VHRLRNNLLALAGILVLVAIAAWMVLGGDRITNVLGTNLDLRTRQGLDLQGGYQLLLQARNSNVNAEQMATARNIIERRVNGLGTNEPNITVQGNNRISVELPGVTDENQIRSAVGSTGRLEFIDAGNEQLNDGDLVQTTYCTTGSLFDPRQNICGTQNVTATATTAAAQAQAATTPGAATATPAASTGVTNSATATSTQTVGRPSANGQPFQTVISGEQLDPAKIDIGVNDIGGSKVLFGVKGEAVNTFGTFTSQKIGQNMAIVLDGRIISSARINGPISNQGEITSDRWNTPQGKREVALIVQNLKYGSLPVDFEVLSSRKIGATLGSDSVNRSILAGAIGLALVAVFIILYFRIPGVLAVVALLIYTLLSLALFKLFGVVLTLAGIAGFILSIGMAVDANVLIFARLKEELRMGRSLERGVEEGFRHAWPAIRDSNVSSLITCLILYWFGDITGTSSIKGFSLTLALGVICSMFTAITVTHTFLRLMFLFMGERRKLSRATTWWFGMNWVRNKVGLNVPSDKAVGD
jgi:preprotein translocase subunit SecD